jgi:multicomponent K+:H+ antiporter subunit D
MIYAVTGTLNLADLARLLPTTPLDETPLLQSGIAILGIAFLVKAGIWPVGFWLPSTYGAAAPPVAAIFAILTKVGIYIILRFVSLLLGWYPSVAEGIGMALTCIGLATMAFGIVSLLASQTLTNVAGSYLIVSSGTLLTAVGFGGSAVTFALLFYLLTSTLAASALYLIIEPVERNLANDLSPGGIGPVFEDEYVGGPEDEEQETEIGVAIPGTVALLGGGFILVALLLAGLPPLPVFIGKFALIDALVHRGDGLAWIAIGLMIVSGLAALIAMTRAGIDLIWKPSDRPPTRINIIEATAIGMLLAVCIALVVWAGPVLSYLQRTAQELHHPANYVESVLGAERAGGPET